MITLCVRDIPEYPLYRENIHSLKFVGKNLSLCVRAVNKSGLVLEVICYATQHLLHSESFARSDDRTEDWGQQPNASKILFISWCSVSTSTITPKQQTEATTVGAIWKRRTEIGIPVETWQSRVWWKENRMGNTNWYLVPQQIQEKSVKSDRFSPNCRSSTGSMPEDWSRFQ